MVKTTNIYFSRFWRLEGWDRGANVARLWSRALTLVGRWLSSGCILTQPRAEREEACSSVSSYKGTNSTTSASPSWSHNLPRASSQNTIALATRVSICEFWGATTFSPQHPPKAPRWGKSILFTSSSAPLNLNADLLSSALLSGCFYVLSN